MNQLAWAAIVGLVSYRVWRFLVLDTILDHPRQWVVERLNPMVREGFECGWCFGTWIALAASLIVWGYGWTDLNILFLWGASAVFTGVLAERG